MWASGGHSLSINLKVSDSLQGPDTATEVVTLLLLLLLQDSESWSDVSVLQVCWINNYFSATHGCSYNCFFSQFVPGYETNNSCWLSDKPDGVTGSQCNG